MQPLGPMTLPQCEGDESGQHASPARLVDYLPAGRRHILVGQLFEYLKEVRRIDDGYALQFDPADDLEGLIGTMSDYILFEGLHSPHLTFAIVGESQEKAFWLEVRGARH